jgi:anti-sigma regulatory factor (Ser/Thr protein kinase)
MHLSQAVEIRDTANVGSARRTVHDVAERVGFTGSALAELDIVAQEIATNAAKYAAGGGLLFVGTPFASPEGIELLYSDKGPGIYDAESAINDGVSTGGSLGGGFGAIRRLMDEFDIFSMTGITSRFSLSNPRRTNHGTALLVRKWKDGNRQAGEESPHSRFGVLSRPRPGETVSGDACVIRQHGSQTLVSVIDGLGHGAGAHEAAHAASNVLDEWAGESVEDVLFAVHTALRSTRGAVMGIAVIDRQNESFQYCGVGNIEARVFGGNEHISPISSYGTLGSRLRKPKTWSSGWRGATLIMTSDGLSSSWTADTYPGLLSHSPQLIAGVFMRDFARETDDAAILVAR